jgi:beta-mannosidase
VPSTVHLDLMDHGLIPDPYQGTQNLKVLWVADDRWEYKLDFDIVNSTILDREILELVFEGLDTLAKVTLNGVPLGYTDNFHRTWTFPVK